MRGLKVGDKIIIVDSPIRRFADSWVGLKGIVISVYNARTVPGYSVTVVNKHNKKMTGYFEQIHIEKLSTMYKII